MYVELKDGTSFVDKFVERTDSKRWLVFEHHKVSRALVKRFILASKGNTTFRVCPPKPSSTATDAANKSPKTGTKQTFRNSKDAGSRS